ncbi:MAG TPA: protein-methionine-sulfoxide reductase heme-binding subunit MsrQ [Anaerolineales bacterium]
MPKFKLTPLQWVVHIGAWIPLAWLGWEYLTHNLTANPIQAATQRTGKDALAFLVLSLACTPLNTLFGFRPALRVRRALGLYAFFYASLHLFIFVVFDYSLDWSLLQRAILENRYVLVGLAAYLILAPLTATSFKIWMKRLGKGWKRLHMLVYLAGPLVIVHFAWAVKGSVLRLRGDVWQPLYYGSSVAVLLILRIPSIRRGASNLRSLLNRSRLDRNSKKAENLSAEPVHRISRPRDLTHEHD